MKLLQWVQVLVTQLQPSDAAAIKDATSITAGTIAKGDKFTVDDASVADNLAALNALTDGA